MTSLVPNRTSETRTPLRTNESSDSTSWRVPQRDRKPVQKPWSSTIMTIDNPMRRAERSSARPSRPPSDWTTRMSINDRTRAPAVTPRRVRHLPWAPHALDVLSDNERADLLAALAEHRVEVTVEEPK